MTYKFYIRTVVILFFLIAFIFFSHDYIVENEWSFQNGFMLSILFFAPTVLSLFLLYISLYAFITRVEPRRKLDRAVTRFAIICAVVCLLGSLIPPIVGYLSFPNIPTDYPTSLSSESLESKKVYSEKISKYDARIYYRKSGQKIEYMDENGNKVLYKPDKMDEIYIQNRQNMELLKKNVISMRINIIMLVAITISSIFVFLVFLGYKTKHKKLKLGRVGSGP